jgi:hypothetical protein
MNNENLKNIILAIIEDVSSHKHCIVEDCLDEMMRNHAKELIKPVISTQQTMEYPSGGIDILNSTCAGFFIPGSVVFACQSLIHTSNKIAAIKLLRDYVDGNAQKTLGLVEAKNFVEALPKPIVKNTPYPYPTEVE